jgi:hypothetical protein
LAAFGGASLLGGATRLAYVTASGFTGLAGSQYGGGGGGATAGSSSSGYYNGGAGAAGVVVVEY